MPTTTSTCVAKHYSMHRGLGTKDRHDNPSQHTHGGNVNPWMRMRMYRNSCGERPAMLKTINVGVGYLPHIVGNSLIWHLSPTPNLVIIATQCVDVHLNGEYVPRVGVSSRATTHTHTHKDRHTQTQSPNHVLVMDLNRTWIVWPVKLSIPPVVGVVGIMSHIFFNDTMSYKAPGKSTSQPTTSQWHSWHFPFTPEYFWTLRSNITTFFFIILTKEWITSCPR